MRVGVVLPRGSASAQPTRVVAQAAESLGYDCIWATEHIAVPLEFESQYPFSDDHRPPWPLDVKWFEAMVTLGFVAGVTQRIRLGTAVIPLLTRDPLSLAKQAATVDVLSGGRLELGLGSGWLKEEGAVLGHPTDRRARRQDEVIDILRKAWSEHPVEHQGEFYAFPPLAVSPKPIQGAGVPIWIGGLSPASLRTTVQRATGNILWNQGPEQVAAFGARLRAERADVRIAAAVYAQETADVAGRQALALQEAGADEILILIPSRAARAAAYLAEFADRHLEPLRRRAAAAV